MPKYEKVRISTLAGVIDFTPSKSGDGSWIVSFETSPDRPRGSGCSLEEAANNMLGDLRFAVEHAEKDVRNFLERNKPNK